jgi:hypothetical protein
MSDHPLIKTEQIGRISAVAGWLAVLIIAILSLVPGNLRPHTVLPGPLEHTLAYALTGAALAFGYRGIDFRFLCLGGLHRRAERRQRRLGNPAGFCPRAAPICP